MSVPHPKKKLKVGIIGLGEVAQVIHLPTLQLLNHLYTVVAICDVSKETLAHCATKFHIQGTSDPHKLISYPDIDVIFNLANDEFHATYTIAALQAGKHVMVEKPMTLSVASAEKIVEAEKAAGGPKVFVGYMRRYASSFTNAFKREISTIPRILYARSRDIIGQNSHFVAQSGTFPVQYSDFPPDAGKERSQLLRDLFEEAFPGQRATDEMKTYWRFLGGLGSHDLSLMRDALGFPESVAGVSVNPPYYSAIFTYKNKTGEPFAVTYESGVDRVPRFDAHLAVYGETKSVLIQYDTPYIKGLPIKVRVDELNEQGEATTREIVSSFEDAYTEEFKELHNCLVDGKEIRTSAEDALQDLKLFKMMFDQYESGLSSQHPAVRAEGAPQPPAYRESLSTLRPSDSASQISEQSAESPKGTRI